MGLDRTIDITAEQRKIVLVLLQRHLPNTTAWVYGSRAKWTSSPQSDLDLVVFATPEQNGRVSYLREALEESSLPFRVDLFVWDTVPEQFRKHIEAEHVVLRSIQMSIAQGREVSSEWQEVRWGDLATLEYGRALRGYDTARGPVRVFGTNGPIGWNDEALFSHPSVIVGRKGAYRGINYSSNPFFAIDTAFYLKPKREMDVRWAYYQLLTQDINGMDSGSAIPSTSRDEFYSLPLLLPPLSEQRAIAHILGTLDDKIELNRRMNETLEAMARALFKSWFVDFEPVRAKMAGRDTGLPSHLADLFPDRLVDSELGKIPEGWEVKALGDVLELTYGKALKADSRRGGSVPVYGSNGRVGWHDEKLAEGPGIVVGRKGNPGVVNWISTDFFAIDTTFIVLPKGGTQVLPFLFFALKQQDLLSIAADSAVPGLNRHLAYMNRQLIPDAAVVERFDKQGGIFFTRRSQLEGESHVLATVRDTLLPKLVSGEIRLHAAEWAVENIQ